MGLTVCAQIYVCVCNVCVRERGEEERGRESVCWRHGQYEITRKLMKKREARWEEFKVVMSTMLKLLIVMSWQKKCIRMNKKLEEKRTFKEAEGSFSKRNTKERQY